MKYQIGAAVTVLAIALFSGTVSADPVSSTILATGFVPATKILNGLDVNFAAQKLKHTAATSHSFAVISKYPPDPYATAYPPDPYATAYPPDPYQPIACRALALTWNVAVYQNRTQTTFDLLIKAAAANNCSLQITRASVANADGSSDMVSVTFQNQ